MDHNGLRSEVEELRPFAQYVFQALALGNVKKNSYSTSDLPRVIEERICAGEHMCHLPVAKANFQFDGTDQLSTGGGALHGEFAGLELLAMLIKIVRKLSVASLYSVIAV